MTTEEAIKSVLIALTNSWPRTVSIEQKGRKIDWTTLRLNDMDPREWIKLNLEGEVSWCTEESIVEVVQLLVDRAIKDDFEKFDDTHWHPPSNQPKGWGAMGPIW